MVDETIAVLCTKPFPDDWLDNLRAVSPRLVVYHHPTENIDDVPSEVWSQVDVLYAWKCLPDLERAPRLRWVQLDTAGYDHVLTSPLYGTDVVFTNLNGVAPPNMAEHAILMILAFGHRLPLMLKHQAARDWPSPEYRYAQFTPRELLGATLGIVGYGSIGREIGRVARAFGMRILGMAQSRATLEPKPLVYQVPEIAELPGKVPDEFYTPDALHEMLAKCDVVVVVAPHTPRTHHMFDDAAFAALKPGAIFVNIARGGVVDEDALIRALQGGTLAGAALDVFEEEPLSPDSPLWVMDNVIISPHVAGLTSRYYDCIFDLFSTNLRRYMAGEPLLNQVMPAQ